ncbi:MAG: hypothetical protein M5U28_14125 [Sandaracinaceae bacterium]|nr:hypothetical protein [Sandaracinaceae bacterium]
MKEDKESSAEIAVTATAEDLLAGTVGTAVGVIMIPLAGAAAPFIGTAVTAGVKGLSMAARAAAQAGRQRAEHFDAHLKLELATSDGLGLQMALDDPHTAEALLHSYRAAMDALDPAVLPAIARLVSWYRGAPLDPFFRGSLRVLRDLTEGDLAHLRDMMALAIATPDDGELVRLAYGWVPRLECEATVLNMRKDTSFRDRRVLVKSSASDACWSRLFDALESHGLGRRDRNADVVWGTGGRGVTGGTVGLVMERETSVRLANLIDASAAEK